VKVCDKTCIFCFFIITNKYLCMAKRSLFSELPSYFLSVCCYFLNLNKKTFKQCQMIDPVTFKCNWKLSFVRGKGLKCGVSFIVARSGVNFLI
jgi:hypothetical protein